MLFLKRYNNTPFIKAKAINSFYIISKITKEVNSIFFGTLVSKPNAIKENDILEISPFITGSL